MVPSLKHPMRKRPQRLLARRNVPGRALVVEQVGKSERVLGEPRVGPEALRVVGQGGAESGDVRAFMLENPFSFAKLCQTNATSPTGRCLLATTP